MVVFEWLHLQLLAWLLVYFDYWMMMMMMMMMIGVEGWLVEGVGQWLVVEVG